MVSINKSFLYGVGVTSVTWVISLYLYLQISKSDANFGPTTLPQSLPKKLSANNDNSKGFLQKVELMQLFNHEDIGELGFVHNPHEQIIRDQGYKDFAYNVLVSDRLSLNREIPDTRNKLCKSKFEENLLTASIIICFYNEHFRTLLRSLYSIIDRTADSHLKEIILVDDYSDIIGLFDNVTNYVTNNFNGKVKLFKTERREGLIRARIFGAQRAKGEVLIFLDSHIEVNVFWLEPLLERIKENKKNVVTPVIDIINPDTFVYSSSPLVRGGFNWGLHFKWENLPEGSLSKDEDLIKPIKSPTMAGGLFAMYRKYFFDIGEYDAGMNIWGGENLEISFRIWMCGGNLEIIPCSRVGHIFRHRRPYNAPDGQDTMLYNSLRVANVWMDQYKVKIIPAVTNSMLTIELLETHYFLEHRKGSEKINYGDISSRLQLRKELKCESFDWYLKNVYPELRMPNEKEDKLRKKFKDVDKDKFLPWHLRRRKYLDNFQIRLTNTSLCMTSKDDIKTKGSPLILQPCLRTKNQMWYVTDKSELVLAETLCLQGSKKAPYLYKCHEMGADQEWKHKGENQTPIYNLAAGTCLGTKAKKQGAQIYMTLCSSPDFNVWDLVR